MPNTKFPNEPTVIAVVGPTAIGKTALGIALAQHYKTEIISADSRQFFTEMTIGTAVPSAEELKAATHHFIQNKSIFEPYSVGDFEVEALDLLKTLFKKHKLVIVVGGSGLYVDALLKGLDSFPEVKAGIRENLNKRLETEGLENLARELEKVDPKHAQNVDLKNPHRVIRALEVFHSSGAPYSSYLGHPKEPRTFNYFKIGLTAPRETIYERINTRVDKMMEQGLLKEAQSLYPNKSLNALQTVGYRELFAHFDGDFSLEKAIVEIKKNTRRFAKRQGTWFRKDQDIIWFDYQTPSTVIINQLAASMPE